MIPPSVYDHQSSSDTVLHELEELLALAEATTKKIEYLQDFISSSRDGFLYKAFGLYVIFASAFYGFLYSLDSKALHGDLNQLLQVIIITLIGLIAYYSGRSFTQAIRQRKKAMKELEIERDVLRKLVSMTFDQAKRAKQLGHLSVISEALIQIRVQKLRSE